MNLKKRKERAEAKRKYKIPQEQFPITMDTTYNAYVVMEIKVPAIIISGSADAICLPQAAEFLHHTLRNSKLFKITGAGHIPFWTQAELCKNILQQEALYDK